MARGDVVINFDDVSFEYDTNRPLLTEAAFSVRRGSKVALMGQNGAWKSTIFQLITRALKPGFGAIHIPQDCTMAIARQVIPRDQMDLTVRQFFEACFAEKIYDIDPRIDAALEAVNMKADHDRIIRSFSGGQKSRLLLASALIQDPDLLLLDEPTNNLEQEGIAHLRRFLADYDKTVIVISHDAAFLNSFTHGVLYLDIFTRHIEQYTGNYFDVVAEISARIEKENRKNAQLTREIQRNKDQANVFAHKGGQMRMVAKRMRLKADEQEEAMVDVRKEDKTIRPFVIPSQPELIGEIVHISSYSVMRGRAPAVRAVDISLRKKNHLLLSGPNGIGKTTLLESIARQISKGARIAAGVRVGYYRQDFSTLNFSDTVFDALMAVMDGRTEEEMRSTAAGFLITGRLMSTKIGNLSEGQKGLVAFAQLVLQKPGLLILDEPTNHINFRHIPIIASALNTYEGAMILVSHVPDFVRQIRIDQVIDFEK